jgi:hypothetical protein
MTGTANGVQKIDPNTRWIKTFRTLVLEWEVGAVPCVLYASFNKFLLIAK